MENLSYEQTIKTKGRAHMGFLFNGIHSSAMGIRARLTDWRFIPAVSNYTVNIPGKEGVADFGANAINSQVSSLNVQLYYRWKCWRIHERECLHSEL